MFSNKFRTKRALFSLFTISCRTGSGLLGGTNNSSFLGTASNPPFLNQFGSQYTPGFGGGYVPTFSGYGTNGFSGFGGFGNTFGSYNNVPLRFEKPSFFVAFDNAMQVLRTMMDSFSRHL
jgi:hypothetical protein